ncbi:MAG: histidine kinase [Eubacteriales bacterium]|nr:histidine kinase [Eubacteriales bacterium]
MMRRFFIRRTIQYARYLLIPIICACFFFGIMMARQAEQALHVQGENSLKAVYSQLDLVVNSVMQQQIRMANDTNMMLALKKILLNDNKTSYSDAIYIRGINTMLNSVVSAHSYLSSIYLYFDGYDSYFASELKTTRLEEADESWLSVYRSMPEGTDGISSLRTISAAGTVGDGEEEKVLSVFRRMLIQEGVVVMNLNLKRLQESLDSMSGDALEGLYLFDAAGNLLTADSKSQIGEGNLSRMQALLLENPDGIPDGNWMRIGSERYLVQVDYYETYQIYLVSLIPQSMWMKQLLPLFGMFALFFLLDCVIAVLISYFTTKRNFGQIEYTLALFEQAEQGIFPEQEEKQPEDEYGVIMNNILHMFLKTTYLDTQLAEKQYRHQVMELSTLQYQINPHFLFNTLQTVELEARKLAEDTSVISLILHDLSDLLKYALANPLELVTLKEELRYLKEYAEIQQYRLGNGFLIYYEVDEEWMEARMLRLLLQPLLENSILHGIRESSRKGYIKVRAYPRDGWMLFSVIDNGVGMTKEEIRELLERLEDENSQNIGLTNVNRRLILYYGEESRLKIQAKPGWGCCMTFRIPMEKMREE